MTIVCLSLLRCYTSFVVLQRVAEGGGVGIPERVDPLVRAAGKEGHWSAGSAREVLGTRPPVWRRVVGRVQLRRPLHLLDWARRQRVRLPDCRDRAIRVWRKAGRPAGYHTHQRHGSILCRLTYVMRRRPVWSYTCMI